VLNRDAGLRHVLRLIANVLTLGLAFYAGQFMLSEYRLYRAKLAIDEGVEAVKRALKR